jgi:hypothetical protein
LQPGCETPAEEWEFRRGNEIRHTCMHKVFIRQ